MSTKTVIIAFIIISACLFSTIINLPANQPLIQEGIVAAIDAETVLVYPGT